MPERLLALELDRALGGEDAAAEARELAALLVAAAEPTRFEVPEAEIEAALAGAQPPRRAPVRRRRRLAVAFAAALALAAAAALVVRTPTDDVQAKAAAPLHRPYFVVEDVLAARPELFPQTVVSGTVDPTRRLGHWTASSGSNVLTEAR